MTMYVMVGVMLAIAHKDHILSGRWPIFSLCRRLSLCVCVYKCYWHRVTAVRHEGMAVAVVAWAIKYRAKDNLH